MAFVGFVKGLGIMKKLLVGGLLALCAIPAHANIVAGGNVDGFGTFVDESTGRTWLRLDNFFDKSPDQMVAAISGTGFQLATYDDLAPLLASLTPITNTGWNADAAIMGSAPDRNIIFGAFAGSTPGMVGWAYGADWDTVWSVLFDQAPSFVTPNGGTDAADMNLWAYQEKPDNGDNTNPAGVPEPMSWVMMLSGFAAVGFAMRSRRQVAVSFQ
jgi:hypothetical protein